MRVLIVNNAHGQKSSAFDKLLHICESLGIETVICTTADDVKTAIAAHDTGRELNAAILSGASQHSVVNKVKQDVLRMNASVMTQLEVPVLGICFGMHIMAAIYGGLCKRIVTKHDSDARMLTTKEPGVMLRGVQDVFVAHHAHDDIVVEVPPGFFATAHLQQRGPKGEKLITAFEAPQYRRYGVAFHPEHRTNPNDAAARTLLKFLKNAGGHAFPACAEINTELARASRSADMSMTSSEGFSALFR